jgi:ankyrin repeat protein
MKHPPIILARAHWLTLSLLAAALGGCASAPPVASPAKTVSAAPSSPGPVAIADRIDFFVEDARNGRCDAVAKALDEGLPVDSVDAVDHTALIGAAGKNQLACTRLLLTRGADPNRRDPGGWTALIHATYFGASDDVLNLLIDKGANVNVQNDRGVTALYLAAASGHENQVRLLLNRGADPRIATKSGYTPERVAQIKGQAHIVKLLQTPAEAANSQTSTTR